MAIHIVIAERDGREGGRSAFCFCGFLETAGVYILKIWATYQR